MNCRMNAAYYRRAGRPIPNHLRIDGRLPESWRTPQPVAPIQPAPLVVTGTEAREWNGATITRRQVDGFINATAMCKAGNKRLNDYLRADRTQEYMRALATSLTVHNPCGAVVAGNPATVSGLVDIRQGGRAEVQGTWIHPRLAVDLARWISPAFAVWMDGWFLETIAQQQQQPKPAPVATLDLSGDPVRSPGPRQLELPNLPGRGMTVCGKSPQQANSMFMDVAWRVMVLGLRAAMAEGQNLWHYVEAPEPRH